MPILCCRIYFFLDILLPNPDEYLVKTELIHIADSETKPAHQVHFVCHNSTQHPDWTNNVNWLKRIRHDYLIYQYKVKGTATTITITYYAIDPDKQNSIEHGIVIYIISIGIIVCVGAQKNRLIETTLLNTHIICFNSGYTIYFSFLPSLIWRHGNKSDFFHVLTWHIQTIQRKTLIRLLMNGSYMHRNLKSESHITSRSTFILKRIC